MAKVLDLAVQQTANLPKAFDLTEAAHQQQCRELASWLLSNVTDLDSLEQTTSANPDEYPDVLHLALKVALSKRAVQQLPKFRCTVVFAMYNEKQRMSTKAECPTGEDFVRVKFQQMNFLFQGTEHEWEVVGVDDGCPQNSAALMQDIIDNDQLKNMKVLRLQDAIDQKLPIAKLLKTTDDSRKGGAILYGLWDACKRHQQSPVPHYVLYTDADNSVDIAMSGLLINALKGDSVCSIGARYGQPTAVRRNGVSTDNAEDPHARQIHVSLRHRLRQCILPPLFNIADTQIGFKCMKAAALEPVLEDVTTMGFSFDMELLLRVAQRAKEANEVTQPLVAVPTCYIDSTAASTFYEGTTSEDAVCKPYFKMIDEMLRMRDRCRVGGSGQAELDFLEWVKDLSFEGYKKLAAASLQQFPVEPSVNTPISSVCQLSLDDLKKLAQ
eukprot:TRINITY_DN97227_c0_g1_i1.p1 TRINITY_DN97227_c0_g1~~TRINITY_DN97227_c0_g1_i1.p1  ORF type:complete len:449 (-),score=63.99 TRINITY_DN97227_c0_g1_i1:232-1551(-)